MTTVREVDGERQLLSAGTKRRGQVRGRCRRVGCEHQRHGRGI